MILEHASAERSQARRRHRTPLASGPGAEEATAAPTRPPHRRGGRWIGAALLLSLVLVGCGDDLPTAGTPCGCPPVMEPVCGVDGRTYPSTCALDCVHVAFDHWGHCGRDAVNGDACSCSRIYEPECGADSASYLNACARTCAGAAYSRDGLCNDVAPPCGCPTNWAPVCGGNGVTYPNDCVLACMDVALEHSGACP